MKKQYRKLALAKDTIRALNTLDMSRAAGGKIKTSELTLCERTDTCACGPDTGQV